MIVHRLMLSWIIAWTGATPAGGGDDPIASPRFVQEQFVIGFWVDPPAEQITRQRYTEIAEAHFNTVIGGFGARTPAQIARQLDLCEQLGLKVIVRPVSFSAADLPDSPACMGYIIRDEPGADEFEGLGRIIAQLRQSRPGKLGFINLYPNYAPPAALGTATYDEHVARYARQTGADVLCMDHYPFMEPHADTQQAYRDNLAVMRKYALQHDVPFWNFFNIMPFGAHSDPTESQVRWQIYTSLAYGARGVLYFCYWTPLGAEFPRGGAIIAADGQRTRHYDQARRINAVLQKLGPTLMQLTSTGVYHVTNPADTSHLLQATPIRAISPGRYLIGTFQHTDGDRAVLINNDRHDFTAWPTVEFEPGAQVTEIDTDTGRERPVRDASPDMPGLQLSLDAGEGRLLLLR